MKELKPLFPLRAAIKKLMKIISTQAFGRTLMSMIIPPLPIKHGNKTTKYTIVNMHSGIYDRRINGTVRIDL